jgi:oxalate decarboxylase
MRWRRHRRTVFKTFLEMFRSDRFQDLSLSDWLTHTPPELVLQHLLISPEVLKKIPTDKPFIVP